jgi:hypothetical protein
VSGAREIELDTGDLPLGGGLLALVRPVLLGSAPGTVVAIRSRARGVAEDLPAWCRLEGHVYLGAREVDERTLLHRIARGSLGALRGVAEDGHTLAARGRPVTTAAMLAAVPLPDTADPATGFSPRGARIEPGGPRHPFDLVERARIASPEVGSLYDQATAATWSAATDVPWEEIPAHEPAIERAVAQIMTFLAENELAALWTVARLVPRIHPAFAEVAFFLASQIADEARHADVYLKRARAAGAGVGSSAAITGHSLRGLLEPQDFTESTFLLGVLGEGTFLDLLRFVELHAPDRCTREIARRTRLDEARHVHHALSHVRTVLAADPSARSRLEGAIARRAASIPSGATVPSALQDALVLLAASATTAAAVARGHEAYRALLDDLHAGRAKRLAVAGFDQESAERLSRLHTPNFM